MTIRAVLFDFGGVLYRTPDRRWMKKWQGLLGLGKDEVISSIIVSQDESPYVQAVMEGRISESEIWQRMGRRWRLSPILVRWLKRSTMNRHRLNQEVATFLASLRPQYRTGILSNAGSDARSMFTSIFGFDHLVDEMIISAEEGVAKPDKRIYQIALDKMGVEPDEAIFLDDLSVNVNAARQIGMKAVRFQDTSQALSDVSALLANGS
jgi:epoxide hydrolase-like predicted phosphatase